MQLVPDIKAQLESPRTARPEDALRDVQRALEKRRDRPALGRLVLRLVWRRGLATAVQGSEGTRHALRAVRNKPCERSEGGYA